MSFSIKIFVAICSLVSLVSLSLPAQATLNGNAKRLRVNVVSITVQPSNDPNPRNGFGFITGENGSTLYIVTAAHNVYGSELESMPDKPNRIQIAFFEGNQADAICVKYWKKEDLALLEVAKPARFHWQKKAIGLKARVKQEVTFIGKNQEWQIPAPGFVTRVDQNIIYADNSYIEPGTSGAPLLNRMGIIGMIVRDDIQRCETISLGLIHRLLRSEGPGYYDLEASSELFNAHSGDIFLFGGVESKRVGVPAYGVYPYTRVFNSKPSAFGGIEVILWKGIGIGGVIEDNKIFKNVEDAFFQNFFNGHTLFSTYYKGFISYNQPVIPGKLDIWARGIYSKAEHNYELGVYEQDFDLFLYNVDLAKKFEVKNDSWRASLGLRVIPSKFMNAFLSFEYAFKNTPLSRSTLESDVYYGHQAQVGIAFKL